MSEAAVSYAALILADAEIEITAEKLLALTKAAGVEDVEPIWAQLFAKALEGQDVVALLTNISVGTSSGAAASSGSASAGAAEAAAEEEVEEAKEESDDDMGFGLFD
ncbi:ribosomal protein 60S [Nadsonia fulvescens var. elongata DSM 6958]|uniref:Ribosomal protein 60S n=1 Tax=Nadsonia fulvescens var. elongata DSM 6958 TaxID=857566 RepID=A0A1E3PJJ4_9ASCO|nr:ribosomal protein 60S [Nadsonia fulvescens var. elongata DSM 6958]